jgi:hypothetical protein
VTGLTSRGRGRNGHGCRTVWLLAALLAAGLCACAHNNANGIPPGGTGSPAPSQSAAPAQPGPLGRRSKTFNCQVQNDLPDPACTPGAALPGVTTAQICTPGYASSVRDVPQGEKNQVYIEYGIRTHREGEYEVDHLVSLELGGSNDIANLWPEAAEPRPGFHEKDRFENYLHDQVCSGRMELQEAQRRIAQNWLQYWIDAGQP